MTPNGRIRLVAYVERRVSPGIKKEIEHVWVRFYADGRAVGAARTDDEGRVQAVRPVEGKPKRVEARVTVGGEEARAAADVFRWTPERPVIAVDLDGTVVRPDYDALLFEREDTESRAITDAKETLSALARDFDIFYLTGRPWYLLEKTQRWLAEQGFPAGAVVAAPGWRQTVRPGNFKSKILGELRRTWPNILIGIGNKPGDAKAYQANQMLSIIIRRKGSETVGRGGLVFRDWGAVAAFFAAKRETLSDPGRLAQAVARRAFRGEPR